MAKKVYIVEDDINIREMLVYALNAVGFETHGYEHAKPFFDALQENLPDIILLDIMLPDQDGLDILKSLRADNTTYRLPVIMITAKSLEYDRIKGLDQGADDYITKPFSVMEVISRVKALLRRSSFDGSSKTRQHAIDDLILDEDRRTVFLKDNEIALTYKEFELLHLLMMNEGIVFSRSKLLERVWGYDYGGGTRTVDMHIRSLRLKLGNMGDMIRTVRSVGYKLSV